MADQPWTIGRALEWVEGYLERKGDESPRLAAQRLLTHATGLERIELYLDLDRPLSEGELATLRDAVARRGAGEPLQYIAGTAPFRYLTLEVAPGVLIPRPETEVLVSEALACLPSAAPREAAWSAEAAEREAAAVAELKEKLVEAAQHSGGSASEDDGPADADGLGDDPGREGADEADGPLLVADICTGSGCIACAIATERPDARVIATDVSHEAVSLARRNAEAVGVAERVRVLEGDLGSPVPERFLGRFHLVVSNPPYVPTRVLAQLPQEVGGFEPALALDGGDDGLDVFRRLLPWAASALRPGGAFACELHEECLEAAAALAEGAGLQGARIVNDLAGRPRVLVAIRP